MEKDNSKLAARIYAQQRNEATLRRVLGEDHPHIRKLTLSTALAQAAGKVEQKLPPTLLYNGPRKQEHHNPRTSLAIQDKSFNQLDGCDSQDERNPCPEA